LKIYLAGERLATAPSPELAALWGRVKRRLFSYFYHNRNNAPDADILESVRLGVDLFLDSGAFTAFTKNAIIDPKLFAQFIKNSKGIWSAISSLDAIGRGEEAAQKSYDNMKILEAEGVRVSPVFHVREPDRWLQRYIDEGYDYIFIGGMVIESSGWLLERLDGLWTHYLLKDHRAKVKVHGFGLTDQKLMFRYPWYSVDSSSWLNYGIYGKCVFPIEGEGRLRPIQFSDKHTDARKVNGWAYSILPREIKNKVDEWLAGYGVTAEQVSTEYTFRDAINAAVYQEMEKWGSDVFESAQETLFGEE
jgi:hypothetical protein